MTAARAGRALRARLSFVSILVFSILVSAASAQTRLEGVVRDAQQRPVPGATVVVIGATTEPRSVRADAAGRFAVDALADGRYDLTASAPGLIGESRGVTVSSGSPARADITMAISAVSETLVVSAAHTDQPLSRVADSVTVIDRAEIAARQLTTVADALASVPGLTVARSGGPGTLTSLFPRGGESDYTLVLVDGVRANGFGGGMDLSQVALEDVERVEVVRGPQSAVFGSEAIGGVVQVITRQDAEPSARGRLEFGSRATRRMSAATTGTLNRWRWQGGGDVFRTEGFTGLAPANGEAVTNDDARETQLWLGSGFRTDRGTDVHGMFRTLSTERGAPGPFGSDPAGRFFGVDHESRGDTERHTGSVRVEHPWFGPASRIRQRVELDVADYDLTFASPFGVSLSETRRAHGRVQTDAVLNAGFGVSGGVEWVGESARSTFIRSTTREVPVERRVIGTFAEARWNGHERISLQAGVRGEHITRKALESSTSRPTFVDDTVVSINPKVAASWIVGGGLPGEGARSWTRLRAAFGTGIRPPDAFEIAFTDNPNLKPERSRSVEVGVTQALRGGRVQVDGTAFFNQFDDLIISVGSLRDVSRYLTDNISNARARGLELGAATSAGGGVHIRAAYTLLDTKILAVDRRETAPPPFRVGDPLLRRPKHQASLNIGWSGDRTTVFADVLARGKALDAEPSRGAGGGLYDNPGRVTLDLGGSFRVARGVEFYLRVMNASDRQYEDVLGYPAPGRTAFAGVRLAASR